MSTSQENVTYYIRAMCVSNSIKLNGVHVAEEGGYKVLEIKKTLDFVILLNSKLAGNIFSDCVRNVK